MQPLIQFQPLAGIWDFGEFTQTHYVKFSHCLPLWRIPITQLMQSVSQRKFKWIMLHVLNTLLNQILALKQVSFFPEISMQLNFAGTAV